MKQLTENDIRALTDKEEEVAEESTGDTTIRAITSLYTGKRSIVGLSDETGDDED